MDLALIWASVIALAVLMYALLDGFDLGIGILFPLFNEHEKDTVIHSIAPVWDGNETWLVLGGGGLFATFPYAYSVLMSAFYAPVIAMLLALVFRGVSIEYRERATASKPLWDLGFCLGSIVAALSQGIMLGAFIQGIEVQDRAYAGGWFDWFTPFSLACGIAILLGYALLGSTWVCMKTHAPANRVAPLLTPLACAVFVAIVILSSWTPFLAERIASRWFAWPDLLWLSPVPVLVMFVTLGLLHATRRMQFTRAFYMAEALFLVTFIGFGISTYPYIVPHQVTISAAAAPDDSLIFLGVGMLFLLPLVLGYTFHAYWVFRGKVPDTHA